MHKKQKQKAKLDQTVNFNDFSIEVLESNLINKNESFWEEQGKVKALKIFHKAAERIPAYKKFLKKHRINHLLIKTTEDFLKVPITDKQNYINKYSLKDLSWDGNITKNKIIASSSGTSGEAKYWPRSFQQDEEAEIIHELLYKNFFEINKFSSLILIGFPMGVYVSGIATTIPSWLATQKYQATIITAGNNKQEALKAIKNLYKFYDQIIFIGHPFFIKDVLEHGKGYGINWKKINLRLMFCSEGFSEAWRDYITKEVGIKNKIGSTISTYGSSEMLLMAYETPLSILIKELAENNLAFRRKLFTRNHAPSIFQYNPLLKYIEEINKELIFTSASGIPLIRFNMHDSGTVLPFSKAINELVDYNQVIKNKIQKWPLWKLPFVSLWGRSDNTIIFYAANIYPEHIHAGLHHKQFLNKVTGKFTMRKGYLKNMDEYLEINVELRSGINISKDLAKNITYTITEKLKEINTEYLFLSKYLDKNIIPKVKLWEYQHPKYFKAGLKPKYIHK